MYYKTDFLKFKKLRKSGERHKNKKMSIIKTIFEKIKFSFKKKNLSEKTLEECENLGLITHEEFLRLKASRAENELNDFLKKSEPKIKKR